MNLDRRTKEQINEILAVLNEYYDLDVVQNAQGIALFILDKNDAIVCYFIGIIDFSRIINAIIKEVQRKAIEELIELPYKNFDEEDDFGDDY